MHLLVLGGTVFLGRHIVQEALAQGHEVTIFNRGQHFPDLFADDGVTKLRGDRRGDISALEGGRWDAVIDTSGHFPRDVRATARRLADSVEHYTFISTINVYPDYTVRGIDESTPLATTDNPDADEITFENYGALKALCEEALEEEMPGRNCSVRAGLIVGRYDFSDRFTYWPRRVAQGGRVLAPGRPERPVQIVDVRDLAQWNIRGATERATGRFNATGPDRVLTMGEVIETSRQVSQSDAEIIWVDDKFLVENEVGAWVELPLWIPESDGADGLSEINCSRAIAAGLRFRPLSETIADTLDWESTRPTDRELRAGMKPEREQQLLDLWTTHTYP